MDERRGLASQSGLTNDRDKLPEGGEPKGDRYMRGEGQVQILLVLVLLSRWRDRKLCFVQR